MVSHINVDDLYHMHQHVYLLASPSVDPRVTVMEMAVPPLGGLNLTVTKASLPSAVSDTG